NAGLWRWRRGRDSNPRAGYPARRFRGAPVTTTSVPLRYWRSRLRRSLRLVALRSLFAARSAPLAVWRSDWRRSLRLVALRSLFAGVATTHFDACDSLSDG